MPDNLKAPHSLTCQEVLKHFSVSADAGLNDAQVKSQLEKFGENKLDEEEKKSLLALVIEQFEDTLVRILLASAMVSFLLAYFDEESKEAGLAAYAEPFVILLILVLNAIVGVYQESNAEQALEALKKLAPDTAFVLRNGDYQHIDAQELVPGDIVEVTTGDKIPADMRLLKVTTTTIRIEQAALTGESSTVDKDTEPLADKDCVIQEKKNMLFSSTAVSSGKALGVVVATGMSTEIGIIQTDIKQVEEEQTPLQAKLDEFGNLLAKLIAGVCILVWLVNFRHFSDPKHGSMLRGCIYYFKIAVALAVAAIPEGLPTVITMCLSLGTRQMAKRNVIVRKLPSVETLGCTTVICSDKTGTLTTNEMCVVKLAMPDKGKAMRAWDVEGTNYTPVGEVQGLKLDWATDKALKSVAKTAAVCNESHLLVNDEGRFVRKGEPTEAAIRVLVEKLGCPDEALNKKCRQAKTRAKADAMAFSDYWMQDLKKVAVLEFNRDRKSMSAMCFDPEYGENVLFVKGAPEMVLKRCSKILLPDGSVEAIDPWRSVIEKQIDDMASAALRTLSLAMKTDLKDKGLHDYTGPEHKGQSLLADPANFATIETDLTFAAMVGILDPPRPECKPAIKECRVAGINVIMITGDNKTTAEAIATNLGILNKAQDHHANSFTGKEFEDMTEDQKVTTLQGIMDKKGTEGAVFSRTEPRHKQMIVKILKSLGDVAAMTGDGVNDAPALKQADIGIAMGIAGTEVAKEASDMILTDDNFSSIVAAVEEGRSIYNNMKAFIRYMISSNVGEVAAIFFTAALGIPEGLNSVQLLWINLVTDGPPATALGFNPPDMDVMRKPPRNKDDSLIGKWSYVRYLVVGFYVGLAVVGIFIYWYVFDTAADGHTLVTFDQLMTWGQCATWKDFKPKPFQGMDFTADPCSYFGAGKVKASTLSLTVLVVIEMLNAFNALSEDGSLVQMPPWVNPYLIVAASGSVCVHMIVLYIPFASQIFGCCPLDLHDWVLVLAFSFPVILIDEVLKFIGRTALSEVNKVKEE
jgi:Ca2+-transporting ATPase